MTNIERDKTLYQRTMDLLGAKKPAPVADGTALMAVGHNALLPKLELKVMLGMNAKIFPIRQGRYKIGRAETSDIRLNDSTVSSTHAILTYEKKNRVNVYDVGSSNGISVEGKKNVQLDLKVGEVIQVGGVYLKLEDPSAKPVFWKKAYFAPIGAAVVAAMILTFVLTSKKEVVAPTVAAPVKKIEKSIKQVSASVRVQRTQPRQSVAALAKIKAEVSVEDMVLEAETAFNNADYVTAYRAWTSLNQQMPGNRSSVEGFMKLEKIARQMLEEAMMVGVQSPKGTKMLQTIVRMTSSEQEVNKISKTYLKQGKA